MCGEDEEDFKMNDDCANDSFDDDMTQSQAGPRNETLVEEIEDSTDEENDVIRILVATDIHVGYGENKPNRYMDSINSFEEVLKIAVEQHVDMILLGGDLFHENHPSRDMLHRVIQLLRQYCLNDQEVSLEFLSDPTTNFCQSRFDRVNYEDSNINVGLPVFTIHGNHDDMAGKGLTALDLLHEAGLINLFGKFEDINQFETEYIRLFLVSPILLRKGATKIALYGIGSQRDDRLCRAFSHETIRFLRPHTGVDEWFNLFAVHQNRPKRSNIRSTGAYLPERYIPSFFDLVVWGHEHECKKACQYVPSVDGSNDGFFILQPGSTIATSLTPDEALPKNVFLVKVKGRKFQCKPIPLQTTRQLIVDEMVLDTVPPGVRLPATGLRPSGFSLDEDAIHEKLEKLIAKAESERGPEQPKLPLIRLKVAYAGPWSEMQPVNARRLGSRYHDRVANAAEMVITKKISERQKRDKNTNQLHGANVPLVTITASNVDDVVNEHFEKLPFDEQLTVLTPGIIGDALSAYADEGEKPVKANKEFQEALSRAVSDVKTKLKQTPLPTIKKDSDGKICVEKFEYLVKHDLMDMKKLLCGRNLDDMEEE